MPEYVVRIDGVLSPSPTREYTAFIFDSSSFSVTVEKEKVTASPHPNVQLDTTAAKEQLLNEITPLLKVLGAEEGRAMAFEVTHIVLPARTLKTLSVMGRVHFKIAQQPTDEIPQKVRWAMVDPIYRDLLDLYTEARTASNPRPAGFKLWERLETKFGNREKARTTLDISNSEIKRLFGDQSHYQGDRHAKYNVGDSPRPLSPTEREEFLTRLKKIVDKYEQRVCFKLE